MPSVSDKLPAEPVAAPVFFSRVDGWLIAVLLLAMVAPLAAVWWVGADMVLALASVLVTLLVCGVLLVPCRYTLESDHLLIRCGLIRQRIPYRDITAITPSRSVWSAPALSLQRVKLSYGRTSSQLVSPRDRAAFIQALQHRVYAAQVAAR